MNDSVLKCPPATNDSLIQLWNAEECALRLSLPRRSVTRLFMVADHFTTYDIVIYCLSACPIFPSSVQFQTYLAVLH